MRARPPAYPPRRPARAQHAVAGHHDRDRVGAQRRPDGARGLRVADPRRRARRRWSCRPNGDRASPRSTSQANAPMQPPVDRQVEPRAFARRSTPRARAARRRWPRRTPGSAATGARRAPRAPRRGARRRTPPAPAPVGSRRRADPRSASPSWRRRRPGVHGRRRRHRAQPPPARDLAAASAAGARRFRSLAFIAISSLSRFVPWWTLARAAASRDPHQLGDLPVGPVEHVAVHHGHALARAAGPAPRPTAGRPPRSAPAVVRCDARARRPWAPPAAPVPGGGRSPCGRRSAGSTGPAARRRPGAGRRAAPPGTSPGSSRPRRAGRPPP